MLSSERNDGDMAKEQLAKVEIQNLTPFIKGLKSATADPKGLDQLKKANAEVASFVIKKAYQTADSPQRKRAAETLQPAKSTVGVYVLGGSRSFPFFGGANFGAQHDLLRLIKARKKRGTNKGRRSRATTVRRDEEWKLDKIIKKVESQTVNRSGKTISRKEAGRDAKLYQVQLQRTKSGGVMAIRGWNQFGTWSKGKDYFLYKAIKQNYDEIGEIYLIELGKVTSAAFPE